MKTQQASIGKGKILSHFNSTAAIQHKFNAELTWPVRGRALKPAGGGRMGLLRNSFLLHQPSAVDKGEANWNDFN